MFSLTFGYLSYLYPFFADDYIHATRIGARYDSAPTLGNVLQHIVWSYSEWNARFGEFMTFFVLYILWHAPWAWCILNTAAALSLICGIFAHVHMRLPSPHKLRDVGTFAFLCASLFVLLAYPGETLFWRTGAVNYLWMFSITLWFLLPIRCTLSQNTSPPKPSSHTKNIAYGILMFALGIIAGMGNENMSAGIAPALSLLTLFHYIRTKKHAQQNTHPWIYWACLGFILGTIALIAAPGPSMRAELMGFGQPSLSNVFVPAHWKTLFIQTTMWNLMSEFIFASLALLLVLTMKAWKQGKGTTYIVPSLMYFCAGFMSIAVYLSMRTGYPARSFFGSSVLFLISPMLLYKSVIKTCKEQKTTLKERMSFIATRISHGFVVLWAAIIIYPVLIPAYQYYHSRAEYNKQVMLEAKNHMRQQATIDTARGWGTGPAKSFAGRFNIIHHIIDFKLRHVDTSVYNALETYYSIPEVKAELLSEVPPYLMKVATYLGSVRRLGKKFYGANGGLIRRLPLWGQHAPTPPLLVVFALRA